MRWQDRPESDNVEDRRSDGSSGFNLPSSSNQRVRMGGIPLRGKTGLSVIIIVLIAGYYGIDLTPLITGGVPVTTQQQSAPATVLGFQKNFSPEEQQLAKFTSVALKTTEEVWTQIFKQEGKTYRFPKLVLYSGSTPTACGTGQTAMGPFYCPSDEKVYLDLSFYQDMQKKYGGGGDFALGYVLAHEVGHHVQTLEGISDKVHQAQQRASKKEANAIQVKMELQADCYAGVWGYYMNKLGILEVGDLDEALDTASAIGDDRLQKEATGRVVPDSFTHGSSEQRKTWFKKGFNSGKPQVCNTWRE